MSDYGRELNQRIEAAQSRVNGLMDRLDDALAELDALIQERDEACQECQHCNDCSVCLG